MPTRRQLIQKIELNSNASSVTFSNIPQNYTDLKLELSVRGSTDFSSQISTDVYIEFNGSTSGYSRRSIYADFPSTVGSTSGSNIRAQINLPISTSNTFTSNKVYIPNYNSSQNKTVSVLSMSETNSATGPRIESVAGLWSSSSAISSIKFTPYTGSFVANSTFYLYGITHVPIIRGGEEYVLDGFKYHKFTSTAALQVIEPGDVEALVVAGGGGGSNGPGAGGGGGGFRKSRISLSADIHAVTVGAGGMGAPATGGDATDTATNGSNSIISSITSTGGGRGGPPTLAGATGGSGGGGGHYGGAGGAGNTPSTNPSQGNNGGAGTTLNGQGGGGGGGAGAVGGAAYTDNGGAGGSGALAFGQLFGGGGGGGVVAQTGTQYGGLAGPGGGGKGGGVTENGYSGILNTGGGGGGAGRQGGGYPGAQFAGGNGGSGIVIIRYPYDGN